MKTSKYHILVSRLLLICFLSGQYMVYAHRHNYAGANLKTHAIAAHSEKTILKEKCDLCDAMHHTSMLMADQVYFCPVAVSGYIFTAFEYRFTSAQLILSGGRAPPATLYIG